MTTTPDPTIRTYHTNVGPYGGIDVAPLPYNDWKQGTPVLIVTGLPEGATIMRLCDVPEGWEWQNASGEWNPADAIFAKTNWHGLVMCRPGQPRTESVPWHEAVEKGRSALYAYDNEHGPSAPIAAVTWTGRLGRCVRDIHGDRIRDIDADGMVEVLRENEEDTTDDRI